LNGNVKGISEFNTLFVIGCISSPLSAMNQSYTFLLTGQSASEEVGYTGQ
jgi:hypothetical protein